MHLPLFLLLYSLGHSSADSHADDSRIIGGEAVTQHSQWAFTAAIFLGVDWWNFIGAFKLGAYSQFICGGVVWDSVHIISAAHCFVDIKNKGTVASINRRLLRIKLGHKNIDSFNWDHVYKVKKITVHKGYNRITKANDIAILQLDREIDFESANGRIKCVCEPQPVSEVTTNSCIALGWGMVDPNDISSRSSDLRKVSLKLMSKCPFQAFSAKRQVCAGDEAGGKDTCRGDSGGPLVCPLTKESSVYTLIGLTSYGPISCGSPIPGVYTFVHHYVDWIGKHTEEGK